MKRVANPLLGLLLFLYGCSGDNAPKGPYMPLVSCLDSATDLIVFVDLASLSGSMDEFRNTASNLPLVRSHPEIKKLLDQQWAVLDSGLAMARGILGVDVLKDFKRVVIGVRIDEKTKAPDMVVVLDGGISPDVFQKLMPGSKPEKLHGVDFWSLPDSHFRVAVVDGKTLVFSGDISEQRLRGKTVPKMLQVKHPELFRNGAKDSFVRLSFAMPSFVVRAARQQMEKMPDINIVNSLLSVRSIFLDVAKQLEIKVACADSNGANHVKNFLDAEAEMILGGQRLVRALIYMAMAFDLDLLDSIPPSLLDALGDRKVQEQTLDQLFPAPQKAPDVVQKQKTVALKADLGILRGSLVLVGILASVAVSEYFEYQQKIQESKQKLMMTKELDRDNRGNKPVVDTDGDQTTDDGKPKGVPSGKEAK